jgi:hypothetical protein
VGIIPILLPSNRLGNNALFIEDDWYYYLEIGERVWSHGYPTFDGITFTSGFHPLWQIVVAIVAAPFVLVGQTAWVPYAVLVVNLALVILVAQLLFSLLRRSFHEAVAASAAVVAPAVTMPFLLNGMESSLLAVSVLTLALALRLARDDDIDLSGAALGVLATFVLLSRWESVILLLLWAPWVLAQVGSRRLLTAAIAPIVALLAFGGLFWAVDGEPVPTSATVKQFWDEAEVRWYDGVPDQSLSGRTTDIRWRRTKITAGRQAGLTVEYGSAGVLGTGHGNPFLLLSAGVLAVSLGVSRVVRRDLGAVTASVAVFSIAQLVYHGIFGFLFWRWYLVLMMVGSAAVLATAAAVALRRLTRWGPALLAGILVSAALLASIDRHKAVRSARGFGVVGAEIVDTLEELEPGTVGSWASGQLGYRSDQPLINLEGLVGDNELLEANEALDLAPFLVRHEVKWLAQGFPFALHDPAECRQEWHRFGIGWHLRMKVLIDHPDAFVLRREISGDRTTGRIFEINQSVLVTSVRVRGETRASETADVVVLPAENPTAATAPRSWLIWPDTHGWSMSGDELRYTVEPPAETATVRLLSTAVGETVIRSGIHTTRLPVPADCRWHTLAVDLDPEATDLVVDLAPGSYLDEIQLHTD